MKLILSLSFLLFSMSAFSLTNSTPALDDSWQNAVMLKADGKDMESGDVVPGYCNAVLVSSQVMVTAAHCVVHAALLKSPTVDIEVGKYRYVTRPDGKVVRVGYAAFLKLKEKVRYLLLPSLTAKMAKSGFKSVIGPEEDIAVLAFDQPLALPADFLYAKVLPQNMLSSVLASASSGILHVLTINFMAESSTDTKRIASLNSVTANRAGYLESKSTSRVEEMDSGGGVFANVSGVYYWLAAVKGRGQNIWSNWDAYTIGVGKVCQLAKSGGLNVDSEKLLCK